MFKVAESIKLGGAGILSFVDCSIPSAETTDSTQEELFAEDVNARRVQTSSRLEDSDRSVSASRKPLKHQSNI